MTTRICNILVVEDDDAVRELLGDILDHQGYEFTLVSNGSEMRAALDDEQFDVAIIDVSLRGEDGYALAETAHVRGCKVILTTGDPQQRERLTASGRHHLLKPFRVPHITELVDRVLSESGALCEKRGGCGDSKFSAAA